MWKHLQVQWQLFQVFSRQQILYLKQTKKRQVAALEQRKTNFILEKTYLSNILTLE